MRRRIAWLCVAVTLALVGYLAFPAQRRAFIRAMITWDAPDHLDPVALPPQAGAGLAPVARTRVILIDGLDAETAKALPAWNRLCDRGVRTTVDVGFPTVSLPVEVSLWSGLTQQQTGVVFRSERPLAQPLAAGIPPRVAGSIAIAENYGYIVRSLGFSRVEPPANPTNPARDATTPETKDRWRAQAREAVRGSSPLAFVHVLRVDTAGHKWGRASPQYRAAAAEADAILDELVALDLDARWFALSDHGHVPRGGHGGEEQVLRHVTGCIAGPGVAPHAGGLVHLVDVSRALADSTGVAPAPSSMGRPLAGALAHPLAGDAALPPHRTGRLVLAALVLLAGAGGGLAWVIRRRRWWCLPVWLPIALAMFVIVRGAPSMSTPMIYPPSGRDMWLTWIGVMVPLALASFRGIWRGATLADVLLGQALPAVALWAAAITACGGWPTVFGAELAPLVPTFTAWCSPLALIAGHTLCAVAVAILLGTFVRHGGSRTSS